MIRCLKRVGYCSSPSLDGIYTMTKKYQGKYLRKKQLRKGSGLVIGILIIFFAGVAVFGGWKFYTEQQEYRAGTDVYESLASSVISAPDEDVSQMDVLYFDTEIIDEKEELPGVEIQKNASLGKEVLRVDFDILRGVNSQITAWITGCGGSIHYPVVQGGDNVFYLNHLIDRSENKNGSIFMDCRNVSDFTDRNTFIYGHNMRNGAMFAALANYGSQQYYNDHPALTLVTPEGTYSLQVFSGYVTPGTSDSYQMEYVDDADFQAYLDRVQSQSDFTPMVSVDASDRIVTLSTCTYDYEDARYVLHCKLVPVQ